MSTLIAAGRGALKGGPVLPGGPAIREAERMALEARVHQEHGGKSRGQRAGGAGEEAWIRGKGHVGERW